MENKTLGCKITVEYCCSNVIEYEDLLIAFQNDFGALWDFLSDSGHRPPSDFTSVWRVVKVEPIEQK